MNDMTTKPIAISAKISKQLVKRGFTEFKTKLRTDEGKYKFIFKNLEKDIKLTVEWLNDDPEWYNWSSSSGVSGNDPEECIIDAIIGEVDEDLNQFDYAYA